MATAFATVYEKYYFRTKNVKIQQQQQQQNRNSELQIHNLI